MILVDTGFWLALANSKDAHHKIAQSKLNKLKEPMITTWPVLTETCHLLLNRMGVDAQQRFLLSWETGAFQVHAVPDKQIPRIRALMEKYSDDVMFDIIPFNKEGLKEGVSQKSDINIEVYKNSVLMDTREVL